MKTQGRPVDVSGVVAGWRKLCLLNEPEGLKEISREIAYRRRRRSPEVIDRILGAVRPADFSHRALVMMLIGTAAAAGDLRGREAFAEAVRRHLAAERGEAYAREQMAGLA